MHLPTFAPLIFVSILTHISSAQVTIGSTHVVGTTYPETGLERFAGIPFAEPPIGSLRLKPPVLKTTYAESELNATKHGFTCLQPPAGGFPPDELSEDCLTLNIWRPAGTQPDAKLPVQFWTYGGGFHVGGSSQEDGSLLVQQSAARGTPMIFINHNYRLGPLGFPRGLEAKQENALNLGLKDHLAALTWVQENIEAFGGDKSKVTVSGISAGSAATAIFLLNPNFTSLARSAILESGVASTLPLNTAESKQEDWDDFVAEIPECAHLVSSGKTFDCLRNLPSNSTSLVEHIMPSKPISRQIYPWVPTIDEGQEGSLLPDFPSKLFERGEFPKVPVLAGTCLDEGALFIGSLPAVNWTTDVIVSTLRSNFSPPLVPEDEWEEVTSGLVASYPFEPAFGSPFNTGNETFGLGTGYKVASAIFGDVLFTGQHRYWAEQYATAGSKWYSYVFTQPQPQLPPSVGVAHGSEHLSLFDSVTQPTTPESDKELGKALRDYWISFIVSQDPNDSFGAERPAWDPYTIGDEALMQLNSNLTMIPDDFRVEQIGYANDHPDVFHR